MAEMNVEKKHDGHDQRESQGLARRRDQSLWSNPAEFFTGNPFTVMRRLSEEMDRAFSGSWSGFGGGRTGVWSPAIDVTERDGKLQVHADLPGVNQDDVKVEVTGDSITIQGERKQEHEEKGKGFYRSERSYGRFFRSIPLPEGAKTDEARAQFQNGVLEVSVPVPQQQENRRQIPIESGSATRREVTSETAGKQRESKAS